MVTVVTHWNFVVQFSFQTFYNDDCAVKVCHLYRMRISLTCFQTHFWCTKFRTDAMKDVCQTVSLWWADEMVDGSSIPVCARYSSMCERWKPSECTYNFCLLTVFIEYAVVFFARRPHVCVHYSLCLHFTSNCYGEITVMRKKICLEAKRRTSRKASSLWPLSHGLLNPDSIRIESWIDRSH